MRYRWGIKEIPCIQTCGFQLLKPCCGLPIVQYSQLSILHGFGIDKQKFRIFDVIFCAVFIKAENFKFLKLSCS